MRRTKAAKHVRRVPGRGPRAEVMGVMALLVSAALVLGQVPAAAFAAADAGSGEPAATEVAQPQGEPEATEGEPADPEGEAAATVSEEGSEEDSAESEEGPAEDEAEPAEEEPEVESEASSEEEPEEAAPGNEAGEQPAAQSLAAASESEAETAVSESPETVSPSDNQMTAQDATIVVTKDEVVKTSTVYAGEIIVDGTSTMRYLYSPGITTNTTVFENLREALLESKGASFSGMVPSTGVQTNNGFFRYTGTAQRGTAYQPDTDYYGGIGEDWSSAAAVARRCFTGPSARRQAPRARTSLVG